MDQLVRTENLQHQLTDIASKEALLADVIFTDEQNKLAELLREIHKSPKQQQEFYDALTTELDKSAIRKEMEKDLTRLTDLVLGVKQHFQEVRHELVTFDSKKYRMLKSDGSVGGDLIEALETGWVGLQNRFNVLVSKSQGAAKEARSFIKDFRETVLELATQPDKIKSALAEVDSTIEKLNQFEKGSTTMASDFDTLRLDVSSYQVKINTVMKLAKPGIVKEFDRQIDETQKRIDELQKKLKNWGIAAIVGWVGTGVGVVGAVGLGAAVTCGLIALTPIGWAIAVTAAVVVVGGGIAAGVYSEIQKSNLKKDIKAAQDLLAKLISDKQSELDKIDEMLKVANNGINQVTTSLIAIQNIWSFLSTDAYDLKSSLEKIMTSASTDGVLSRIKTMSASYKCLEQNLEYYCTQMAVVEGRESPEKK